MKKFVQAGYDLATKIIEANSAALIKIAETLLEREVLDGAEVRTLIDGGTLPPHILTGQGPKDGGGETQQVIRPEGGRRLPGLEGERPHAA